MRTAIGVADHCGWAVLVCVVVEGGEYTVVDRRRVELIDAGLPKQPFEHDTAGMDVVSAERLIDEVRESAVVCSERALARVRAEVRGIECIVLRAAALEKPATLAESRASRFVYTRADGVLFHHALVTAAKALGIDAVILERGEEAAGAAEAMGGEAALEEWLTTQKERLGAPWQKDHREAAMRAVAALAASASSRTPRSSPPRGRTSTRTVRGTQGRPKTPTRRRDPD